jgi:hypothetical protein
LGGHKTGSEVVNAVLNHDLAPGFVKYDPQPLKRPLDATQRRG